MSNDDDDIDDIVKRGPDVIGGMGHAQKAQAAALRRHSQRDEDRAALEADLNKIGAKLLVDHNGQVLIQCPIQLQKTAHEIMNRHDIIVGNFVQQSTDPQSEKQRKLRGIVESIRITITRYSKVHFVHQLQSERANLDSLMPGNPVALAHALWMCSQIDQFINELRLDKANRWIGFMQGILWIVGVASIEESRQVNT